VTASVSLPAKTGAQAKALSCTTKRWLQGADLACGPGSELARAARLRPSPVLARINSRSNSAKPPRTVSMSLPCGVVVSAQLSLSERKPAPRFASSSSRLSKSLVERASRSSRVTTSTSPCSSLRITLANSGRSVFAPGAFSLKMLPQPAACSSAIWLARSPRFSPRPHRRCWPARPDLCWRWRSRLVATATEDRLNFRSARTLLLRRSRLPKQSRFMSARPRLAVAAGRALLRGD
jgi:hypothetical protein